MDPGDPLLRTETAGATNTCEMFGIWGRPEGDRVKLNDCAGWTYRTLAPRHGFEPRSSDWRSPAYTVVSRVGACRLFP